MPLNMWRKNSPVRCLVRTYPHHLSAAPQSSCPVLISSTVGLCWSQMPLSCAKASHWGPLHKRAFEYSRATCLSVLQEENPNSTKLLGLSPPVSNRSLGYAMECIPRYNSRPCANLIAFDSFLIAELMTAIVCVKESQPGAHLEQLVLLSLHRNKSFLVHS